MTTEVTIQIVAGNVAPRYDETGMELTCDSITITEQGTQANLPVVDFKMRGPDGRFYLLVMSGRIVNLISATVRGVNLRNHGVGEP